MWAREINHCIAGQKTLQSKFPSYTLFDRFYRTAVTRCRHDAVRASMFCSTTGSAAMCCEVTVLLKERAELIFQMTAAIKSFKAKPQLLELSCLRSSESVCVSASRPRTSDIELFILGSETRLTSAKEEEEEELLRLSGDPSSSNSEHFAVGLRTEAIRRQKQSL